MSSKARPALASWTSTRRRPRPRNLAFAVCQRFWSSRTARKPAGTWELRAKKRSRSFWASEKRTSPAATSSELEQGQPDRVVMATVASEQDVPASGEQAKRIARRSRFMRVLLGVTALVHIPVALGVGEVAARLGLPRLTGVVWAAAGVALFATRVRATPDRRSGSALRAAIDVP